MSGSGTFSGFNPEQEHIQPQGSFVYVKGLEARPIRVTFHRLDPAWTIATQLVPTDDSGDVHRAGHAVPVRFAHASRQHPVARVDRDARRREADLARGA